MLTVLIGGARSGKSALAVDLASRAGTDVTYLATSPRIPGDVDLDERIASHRAERPADWNTVEEQIDLAGALGRSTSPTVIIDCLTVWVGNLLHHGHGEADVLRRTDDALAAISGNAQTVIAITNEVGLGIVPDNELARAYRDALGRVNQRWVGVADDALFLVAGRAIALRDPHDLLR